MIDRCVAWWRRNVRGRGLARSIQEEMDGHLEEETDRLVAAGRSQASAEREARRRFGDLARYRRAGHIAYGIDAAARPRQHVFEALWRDVTHSARSLVQRPSWTALAVATLALGISGNTALFGVLNAALLRPLPYPDAEGVLFLWSGEDPANVAPNSYPDVADWRAQATTFEKLAPYNIALRSFTDGTEPERILGAIVDAGFFDILGVRPQLGRTFTAAERLEGAEPVIILDHYLWQRRYGADPDIVGRTINDGAFRVVGVMPPEFDHPEPHWDDERTSYWLPLVGSRFTDRTRGFLRTIGRLRENATMAEAQAELTTIASRVRAQHPQDATPGVWVRPLREEFAGAARRPLLMLALAAGFVLLIACANVAHLLLTRTLERKNEFAVRLALGASRGGLLRLQLVEGLLLATAGAIVGLVATSPLAEFLSALGPTTMPGFEAATLDRSVLLFAALATGLTGVVTSLLPWASGLNSMAPPGGQTRSSAGRLNRRSRHLLIVGEVVLAIPLLVGAAMLMQSLMQLGAQDLGFRQDGVLTLRLTVPARGDEARAFFEEVVDGLRALPQVSNVGSVSSLPLDGLNYTGGTFVSDTGNATDANPVGAATRWASNDYFAALEIPLLAGRWPEDEPNSDGVVVSAGFASSMWGSTDIVGQRLRAARREPDDEVHWRTVVGVVGDVNERGPEFEPDVFVFLPAATAAWDSMGLVLRTQGPRTQVAADVRAAVGRVAPQIPITSFAWMEDRLDGRLSSRRFRALLLGGFAALGLTLAAIGVFGVVSHSVRSRDHELGIRMALGAMTRDVTMLVIRELAGVVGVGVTIGLAVAISAQRVLGHLVAGLETLPAGTAFAAAAFLAGVALVAGYLPARRAARVDPLIALRRG
ncbi:MAG: FtsX-like permease family protein [Acidobacteria bacterium]|nr:FtsX-like permease family protein [Acidobacteriota bacterium]